MGNTITEIVEKKLIKRIEERGKDLSGVVLLDIDGPEGGKWTIDCDEVKVLKKEIKDPNVTIIISDENFKSLVAGKLNVMSAMFTGKLKIKGDMSLASKLAMVLK